MTILRAKSHQKKNLHFNMKSIIYSTPISLIIGILVIYINWNYFSILSIVIFIFYIFFLDTAKDWQKFRKNQNL